ncbi:MAG: DUF2231 domain-containing protein [Chthoniobacter sp.]|uniref:DUF2231 domain-containing protein n=1 Tax=Chthoniobacter sp. TaxID=2510640 RepID=UPI0032A9997B
MNSHQQNSKVTSAAANLLALLALALPATALAHEGESSGPWIDFSQYGFDGLSKMFNVHPAFVHFPIALIPTMLLLYCLGTSLKKPALLVAGRVTLYLAFISLALVVYTGMAARSTPSNDAIEQIMGTHKNTGWVLLVIGAILTAWSFWTKNDSPIADENTPRTMNTPKANWAFLLVGALATYLVFQNADLGAKMVYLHGAAVTPMVETFKASGTDKGGEKHHDAGEGH